MSKQLILITAPFGCGHCARAIKEVPPLCEEKGWEFIEMKNSKDQSEDNLPVDLYPTIMVRVGGEMKEIIKGYSKNTLTTKLEKY
tara:strand:- start:268 stop:522 length:255 start_codon:yes stop_codon:yes gene_type:complete